MWPNRVDDMYYHMLGLSLEGVSIQVSPLHRIYILLRAENKICAGINVARMTPTGLWGHPRQETGESCGKRGWSTGQKFRGCD